MMFREPDYVDIPRDGLPMLGEWKITRIDDETGKVLSVSEDHNLITDVGRIELIKLLLGFTAAASGNPFIAMGVGACATAADYADTRLTYELIGNATRKQLEDVSAEVINATADASDIESETLQVAGPESGDLWKFRKKMRVRGTYASADLNNGNTFREYGIFTSLTLPGSPTGTSGIMFNHFIDPNPTAKIFGETIVAEFTLRF
jgi:hypothetical protein